MTEPPGGLDPERAERYARSALANITRPYPNAPALTLRDPGDLREPRELHPAFYGSYDWHSSVHMHWSLIRLLRSHRDLACAGAVMDRLRIHLSAGALAAEADYLRRFPLFERPYGWGWALALVAEANQWEEGSGVLDLRALQELAAVISGSLETYLRISRYANRAGTHGNSAFALILALHYSRLTRAEALELRIREAAMQWYRTDRHAPVHYEPSGEDFLSPSLCEAHLMSLLLSQDELSSWLDHFLPSLTRTAPTPLGERPLVGDPTDGRIAHLYGLMLSRAWNWRSIGQALPISDPRRDGCAAAAAEQLKGGLPIVLSDNYETDHWLISFALLALQGLDIP